MGVYMWHIGNYLRFQACAANVSDTILGWPGYPCVLPLSVYMYNRLQLIHVITELNEKKDLFHITIMIRNDAVHCRLYERRDNKRMLGSELKEKKDSRICRTWPQNFFLSRCAYSAIVHVRPSKHTTCTCIEICPHNTIACATIQPYTAYMYVADGGQARTCPSGIHSTKPKRRALG